MTPHELRATLDRLDLSAAEAGHLLGVHRATIYRWLDGSMSMPIVVELLLRLILLRHKLRRVFRVKRRAQQGHRGRVLAIATINMRCTVAIELGTCRWGRSGGAAGSVTGGNGRFCGPPGANRGGWGNVFP